MTNIRKRWQRLDSGARQYTTEQTAQQQRTAAVAHIYQVANRIITGRPVTVSTAHDPNRPVAWSAGDQVIINTARLANLTDADIVTMTGADFHEISHVLFSPRQGSQVVDLVQNNPGKWMESFNILEDSRIERLMIARHPSMRGFLTHVVTAVILKGEDTEHAYPLIAGRTYLPRKAREALRRVYLGENADELEQVARTYSHLVLPRDDDRAFTLIEEFARLLARNTADSSCTHRAPSIPGEAEPEDEQARLQQRADEQEEEEEAGQEKADAEKADAEEPDTRGEEEQEEEEPEEDEDIEGVLREVLRDVLNEREVQDNVADTRRQLSGAASAPSQIPQRPGYHHMEAFSPDALALTRRIAQESRRLIETHDPGWEREQPNGRLNMAAVMQGRDLNEVFDRWDEGEEGVSMEVVLLLDCSGSMCGHPVRCASESAAILQRGLVSAGITVSTYSYAGSTFSVYTRGERPAGVQSMVAGGDTQAGLALEESYRVLHASQARRKLAVVLTDGDWSDDKRADSAIALLQAEGVTVAVAFTKTEHSSLFRGQTLQGTYGHEADVFAALDDTSDLVPFTRSVVTKMLRTPVRR